jgi:hypothetical protein
MISASALKHRPGSLTFCLHVAPALAVPGSGLLERSCDLLAPRLGYINQTSATPATRASASKWLIRRGVTYQRRGKPVIAAPAGACTRWAEFWGTHSVGNAIVTSVGNSPPPLFFGRLKHSRIARVLGPGLITGAADDDPSGIATYSQAGAQFGDRSICAARPARLEEKVP